MADAPPADRSHPQPIPLQGLRELGAVVTPLPAPLTSFVGRAQEVAAVVALLGRVDVRLVTLTGPGGVGKTRIALKVVEEGAAIFGDGVAFVPLAAITDPNLVLPAALVATVAVRQPTRGAAAHPPRDPMQAR